MPARARIDAPPDRARARSAAVTGVLCAMAVLLAVARPAEAAVIVREAVARGIPSFQIETPSATYLYDKAGAGFVSIRDRDGRDWIGFRPAGSGAPDGAHGWYRGLPNLALDRFGHPGYAGARTRTPDPLGVPLERARIRSTKDGWAATWEFHDDFARLTVTGAEGGYWLLYEGTPGGTLDAGDRCWRSGPDGRAAGGSCANAWDGDLPPADASEGSAGAVEWAAFADPRAGRSLLLLHPDDAVADTYFPMDGMTVFGFGRTTRPSLWHRALSRLGLRPTLAGLLERVPDRLVVTFVETVDASTVAARAGAVAARTLGAAE